MLAAPNNTHIHPLEKSRSLLSNGIAFYGSGWRGPGLSTGKFRVYFSPKDASSDKDGRRQNPGWRQRFWGLTQLGSFLAQSRGVGISFWDPFIFCFCPHPTCLPGGSRTSPPKVGRNQCQEYLCACGGASTRPCVPGSEGMAVWAWGHHCPASHVLHAQAGPCGKRLTVAPSGDNQR